MTDDTKLGTTDNPSPDPYTEGYLDHDLGRPASANPHDSATDFEAHSMWNDGWHEAEADDVEVASIMGDDDESDEELDRQTSRDLDSLTI